MTCDILGMVKKQMERRITLRLPEELAKEVDVSIEVSGMPFTEFLRRACREKLDRDAVLTDADGKPLTRGDVYKKLDEMLPEIIKHIEGND